MPVQAAEATDQSAQLEWLHPVDPVDASDRLDPADPTDLTKRLDRPDGSSQVADQATRSAAPTIGNWLSVVSHLDPKYGGLSTVVPQLASMMVKSGHFHVQMEVFCLPEERCKPVSYPELPISFWPVSRKRWLLERSLTPLFRRAIAQSDAIHIHGLWEHSTLISARTARAMRKPYIVSAHGMLEPWALERSRLKKKLYAALFERANVEGARCLHALTEAEAQDYRDWGSRRPIAVIPNGVDVPAAALEEGAAEAFLHASPAARGKRLLLFLGRLHTKKGVELLLRAWARLAARFPDALLVMAGPSEGRTRETLEALATELGVGTTLRTGNQTATGGSERTLFTGMLDAAMKWSALAAAECFVLPSYSEGLSVATLEAMGAGVPVIVTRQCHLPEVSRENAGWETEPDVDALTATLERCLGNTPGANKACGQRGAALVARRYSWPVVAVQMAELYTWVQGGPEPVSFQLQFAGADGADGGLATSGGRR